MNHISKTSLRVLTGGLGGFLIGYIDCVSFHATTHGLMRPLADSVYEIGGTLVGGTIGLVLGSLDIVLTVWRQKHARE